VAVASLPDNPEDRDSMSRPEETDIVPVASLLRFGTPATAPPLPLPLPPLLTGMTDPAASKSTSKDKGRGRGRPRKYARADDHFDAVAEAQSALYRRSVPARVFSYPPLPLVTFPSLSHAPAPVALAPTASVPQAEVDKAFHVVVSTIKSCHAVSQANASLKKQLEEKNQEIAQLKQRLKTTCDKMAMDAKRATREKDELRAQLSQAKNWLDEAHASIPAPKKRQHIICDSDED